MWAIFFFLLLITAFSVSLFLIKLISVSENYGAPPYVEDEVASDHYAGRFGDLSKWVRPEGPLRVAQILLLLALKLLPRDVI
ncbi:hypothetical protein A3B48_03610 [Candidatus Gottesmanbacteria bacterium RIFCSPLOWO2_01_FULL_40_10]|nr:MAG: hypothetical protein A3B48_03610 [Candidatus Gottesmanbacteria bacterium RIFCSPLOWO2_01_FULL_40_10]